MFLDQNLGIQTYDALWEFQQLQGYPDSTCIFWMYSSNCDSPTNADRLENDT